jgi:pimeloyl-ACP methyl ester carboxylesterase
MAVAAADTGLRLLAYDRADCGGSSPQPDRTGADTPTDVAAALADQLQLDRFAVWVASCGGRPRWPVWSCG